MVAGAPLEAALAVIRVLQDLRVDYLVGGSLASSLHGTPRSTNDVDLVVDLKLIHVPLLAARLEDAFYFDADRARQAVRRRSSFNVIYLRTMFKIDLFVLANDPLAKEEMRRRQRVTMDEEAGVAVDVASPEDTVLRKLEWFRRGGGRSDRQWQDLLGVLKVQKELDLEYMSRWSAHLGVEELYSRALRDAGR